MQLIIERDDETEEWVVYDVSPRCRVELFRGDIAEVEDFREEHLEANSQFGVGA